MTTLSYILYWGGEFTGKGSFTHETVGGRRDNSLGHRHFLPTGLDIGKKKSYYPRGLFPEFSFPMTLSRGEIEYLGLPTKFLGLIKGDTFSLKDIKAELIVVEYMNKYCFSCQLQAPVLNQVYETVGNDPQLKGRVIFFAMAAGNNQMKWIPLKRKRRSPFRSFRPQVPGLRSNRRPGSNSLHPLGPENRLGPVVARAKIGLTKDPEVILKGIQMPCGPTGTPL